METCTVGGKTLQNCFYNLNDNQRYDMHTGTYLIQEYVLFAYSREHIIDCKTTLVPFLLGNASSAAVSMAYVLATLHSGAEPFNMEAWNWLDETSL